MILNSLATAIPPYTFAIHKTQVTQKALADYSTLLDKLGECGLSLPSLQ
ncbi:MAG: hypothetical protein VSS75_022250 [Candidatus Parabeggiatoa sp.]|nr:hypothetical protein [Candidatus Parabeggiatoa sp.]